MAEEYEAIQLVKPEVFVYNIPPRVTTRTVRAADWNLPNPDWKGRMKIVAKRDQCIIKLEDRTGELFALCPVDSFPGLAVEPVSDSSRYFVLRLQDSSGKHAFVGLGFQDRGDSFDFNVALQEHFKGIKRDQKLAEEAANPQYHVDYSLKAGQKISLNIGDKLHSEEDTKKTQKKPEGISSFGGILLPPPSSNKPVHQTKKNDEFGDFLSGGDDPWGGSKDSGNDKSNSGWVQF